MKDADPVTVPYWAPYHEKCIIQWMTLDGARWRHGVINTKPADQIRTRHAAFRIVEHPERLPAELVAAAVGYEGVQAEVCRVQAEWGYVEAKAMRARTPHERAGARAEFDRMWIEFDRLEEAITSTWSEFQRLRNDPAIFALLDAQRREEYPDAPAYDIERGLLLPDGRAMA